MSRHTKTYLTMEEMLNASKAMTSFQVIHNSIRLDYSELLRITETFIADQVSFDSLYRASLRSLLSIIEADIHGLNQLDQYEGYDDLKQSFIDKFKFTYKQIATTWNKIEVYNRYADSKITALKILKKKRDELVHPKETEHLHSASVKDFNDLKDGFESYNSFVNELMTDFWVGVTIPSNPFFGNR